MAGARAGPNRSVRRRLFRLLQATGWLATLFGWKALRPAGHGIAWLNRVLTLPWRRGLVNDIAQVLEIEWAHASFILRQAHRINDRAILEVVALGAPWFRPEPMISACRIDNLQPLHAAVAKGGGAILLGLHMGNGILMCARLAQLGLPVSVAYRESRKLPPGYLGRCLERAGVDPIHLDRDRPVQSSRRMLRALRSGRLIYVLMDQGTKHHGIAVRFLGKNVQMPTGIVRLARRTNAPLIPILPEAAEPAWRFRVTAPVELAEEIPAAVVQLCRLMEDHIRRHPELWAWHHRRWRRYPVEADQFEPNV